MNQGALGRLAVLWFLGSAALVAAAACSYPDFTFVGGPHIDAAAPQPDGGDAGNDGGDAGDGEAGLPPAVPCTLALNHLCGTGQVCCHQTGTDDFCGKRGACGAGFTEFACNTSRQCGKEICCAILTDAGGQESVATIGCQARCDGADNLVVCNVPADCPPNQVCGALTYPGYGLCQ